MRVLVALLEALDRNVRVNLSCAQARVTEQFLNGSQVGTTVEQVGCGRVAKRVRSAFARWRCFDEGGDELIDLSNAKALAL